MQPCQRDKLALVRGGDNDGGFFGLGGGYFGPSGGGFGLRVRRLQLESAVLCAREQVASIRHSVHALVASQLAADVRRLVRVIVAVAAVAVIVVFTAGCQDGLVVVVLLCSIPISQRYELWLVVDGLSRHCRHHRRRSHRSRRATSLLAIEIYYN